MSSSKKQNVKRSMKKEISAAQKICDQAAQKLGTGILSDRDDNHNINEIVCRILDAHNILLHPNQIVAAQNILSGAIVQLATGEGKTYSALVAAGVLAARGEVVHVATANPYLAQRDADVARELLSPFGLTVGYTAPKGAVEEKRNAYQCDIVYGDANEFGFDWLRDSLAEDYNSIVGIRGRGVAIVDEADSVLIDNAAVPMIVSLPRSVAGAHVNLAKDIVKNWVENEHYDVDWSTRSPGILTPGVYDAQNILGIENLFDLDNAAAVYHLDRALGAHIMRRDIDYAIIDGTVQIVDSNTGRIAAGRSWSDGLHQAIEAKEGLELTPGNGVAASVSAQHFWKSYDTLAGLTGTARGSHEEFGTIYGCDVVEVPSHEPNIREDRPDVIFRTSRIRFEAAVERIKERAAKGQAVLVGCVSVEDSETLSLLLKEQKIEHDVLNAKEHAREADIIAAAGVSGKVTVTTAMAGRGVDIELDATTREAGGLCIIGCGRNDSARVDDQLRGRAGRQGSPGVTEFLVALDDDLVAHHTNRALKAMIGDESFSSKMATKMIDAAQNSIEAEGFKKRTDLMQYDDILFRQANVEHVTKVRLWEQPESWETQAVDGVERLVALQLAEIKNPTDNNISVLFPAVIGSEQVAEAGNLELNGKKGADQLLRDTIWASVKRNIQSFEGETILIGNIYALVANDRWSQYLDAVTAFKDGIGLRKIGGSNPLAVWTEELNRMWEQHHERTLADWVGHLATVQVSFNETATGETSTLNGR